MPRSDSPRVLAAVAAAQSPPAGPEEGEKDEKGHAVSTAPSPSPGSPVPAKGGVNPEQASGWARVAELEREAARREAAWQREREKLEERAHLESRGRLAWKKQAEANAQSSSPRDDSLEEATSAVLRLELAEEKASGAATLLLLDCEKAAAATAAAAAAAVALSHPDDYEEVRSSRDRGMLALQLLNDLAAQKEEEIHELQTYNSRLMEDLAMQKNEYDALVAECERQMRAAAEGRAPEPEPEPEPDDTLDVYECVNDCGFSGGHATVAAHETTCGSGPGAPQPDEAALEKLAASEIKIQEQAEQLRQLESKLQAQAEEHARALKAAADPKPDVTLHGPEGEVQGSSPRGPPDQIEEAEPETPTKPAASISPHPPDAEKETQHAKHSEVLESRNRPSSPTRQRRGAGGRSPEARAPVLTTALHRLYEGLVSERAARAAFEKLDKDGSGKV